MKIICSKSDLLSGVNTALRAVPVRTTMPILECIIIDTENNKINLTANDMDMGIKTSVSGDILEGGKIAVEAKLFADIVRKLPDSDVYIETDDNYQALIKCEKTRFNIAGKSGDEFPLIPEIDRNYMVSLSQFSLKEIIRQTIFSASDNENNRLMSGELFDIDGNILKAAALDGQRIAIRKIELSGEYERRKVVVPGKTLSEIGKILSGEIDKNADIFITDNHILFEFEDTLVLSRLIEGEYFDIDRMISSDYNTRIVINKKEFQSCLERSTLFIKENERKPIILNIKDDKASMTIKSALGSFDEEIDIDKEGKDLMIGFNPKFVIDALRVIDDEEVRAYLVNARSPFIIKNDEESYLYLILPISFIG